jgi:hypothetical protein
MQLLIVKAAGTYTECPVSLEPQSVAYLQERMIEKCDTILLTPFAVCLLTGYLVCICVSIIMVDTMNTFCELQPFSFYPTV